MLLWRRLEIQEMVTVYFEPNLVNMRLLDVNRNVRMLPRQDRECDQHQCAVKWRIEVTRHTLHVTRHLTAVLK